MGGGHGQVEGQHLQEQVLHSQQLPLCVGVVRYVDKLVHLGRVDLFVLPVKGKARGSNAGNLRPFPAPRPPQPGESPTGAERGK